MLIAGLGATGLTVDALVGAHDFRHLTFLYQSLECGEIGFPEVSLGQILDIEGMAVPFRTAMNCEMFGAGEEFLVAVTQLFTVVGIALQPSNYGESHLRGQVGILAVCLLTASPARVAEDIDIGSPKRQALITLDVT